MGLRPAGAADGAPEPPLPSGRLRRLVAAECAAEAPAAGEDPHDLQQAVWLRWLEAAESGRGAAAGSGRDGAAPSARWVRRAVRAEARRARRRARREVPLEEARLETRPGGAGASAEAAVLAAEERRALAQAVARLPGPCPPLLLALFYGRDLTYPEIAGELGMSQGSLGPVRSRCLGCLRTMLAPSDCGT